MRLSFLTILVSLFFTKCATQKIDKTPPVSLKTAFYQPWVAGIRGGGSGINLFLGFHDTTIVPDSAYFRNQVRPFKAEGDLYVARFSTAQNQQPDMILHKDPQQEYGNTLPNPNSNFDHLSNKDAMIRYRRNEKIGHFIIQNIEKKPSIPFPQAPQD